MRPGWKAADIAEKRALVLEGRSCTEVGEVGAGHLLPLIALKALLILYPVIQWSPRYLVLRCTLMPLLDLSHLIYSESSCSEFGFPEAKHPILNTATRGVHFRGSCRDWV
jgi:hypothetical protein